MAKHGIEKYISPRQKQKIMGGHTPSWMTTHKRGQYIIKSILSAPLWVKRSDFAGLRAEADGYTEITGIKHVLDHKVPIDHPKVCGLTVPWNMEVVTWYHNARKGNAWSEEECEQADLPL